MGGTGQGGGGGTVISGVGLIYKRVWEKNSTVNVNVGEDRLGQDSVEAGGTGHANVRVSGSGQANVGVLRIGQASVGMGGIGYINA